MVVNPFWKLEVSLMYECMYALLFLTWNTYLEAQKSVTLELQLNPINHKTCRGSWNLVLMTLGDATHIFLERCLLQHPETRLNILLYQNIYFYFIVFPAILSWLNDLSICTEGLWIEVRWYKWHPTCKFSLVNL